ncbi:basic proline-rich protein-like [Ursus maritimus]|uniref:Basic proline-rich protein-like n=1 Tax=Ursus maritimus TaxID=29073 RepID=A0A8M1FGN7_URSMA|nr:basic proline-rich protein-like [Ursus maritimus]
MLFLSNRATVAVCFPQGRTARPPSSRRGEVAVKPGRGLERRPALRSRRPFAAAAGPRVSPRPRRPGRGRAAAPARPARSHAPALRAPPLALRGPAPTPVSPLPSGPAAPPGPEPGPRAPSPLLPRSSPAWEPGPGPPGAEQLGARGSLPREGKGDEPRPGARGEGLPLWGAPSRAGTQRPLTRWLARPRGCVSGSPAAPGRAWQIPTANAEREWASGTGEGERERGPCSRTCQSGRKCIQQTRDRGRTARPPSSRRGEVAVKPGRGLERRPALRSRRPFAAAAGPRVSPRPRRPGRGRAAAPARPARSHAPALRAPPLALRGPAPTPVSPLPSGPAAPPGPEPGPRAPSPLLPRSSPAWEPGPGPPGAEQLGARGSLPREGKGDEPRPGARGEGLPLWGAPSRAGTQRPLTRWLARPRGCVSGSPAAPGRAWQIPTANAEREWASGTGEGERERGPCSRTCQSGRKCIQQTRDRGTHTWAHSCLPAQQAGRDATCLANLIPRSAPKYSISSGCGPSLSLCRSSGAAPRLLFAFCLGLSAAKVSENCEETCFGKSALCWSPTHYAQTRAGELSPGLSSRPIAIPAVTGNRNHFMHFKQKEVLKELLEGLDEECTDQRKIPLTMLAAFSEQLADTNLMSPFISACCCQRERALLFFSVI